MRVVYFTETFLPKLDGVVMVLCLLLDHLKKRGIPSLLVTSDRGVRRYADTIVHGVRGFPVVFYPELHTAWPGGRTLEIMRQFRPTIVHLIHPTVIGMPAIWFARKLGVPLLASFHADVMRMARHYRLGALKGFIRAYTRWTYNQADYTLATSRRMMRYLQDQGIRNVGLWRRGVDPGRFGSGERSQECRARLTDGHPERVILLFVGRAAAEKRVELLREVVAQVAGTHLAVVGDGPHLPALRRYFARART
jgi:glycosyltransferase involved in cell wall biosynthesis